MDKLQGLERSDKLVITLSSTLAFLTYRETQSRELLLLARGWGWPDPGCILPVVQWRLTVAVLIHMEAAGEVEVRPWACDHEGADRADSFLARWSRGTPASSRPVDPTGSGAATKPGREARVLQSGRGGGDLPGS